MHPGVHLSDFWDAPQTCEQQGLSRGCNWELVEAPRMAPVGKLQGKQPGTLAIFNLEPSLEPPHVPNCSLHSIFVPPQVRGEPEKSEGCTPQTTWGLHSKPIITVQEANSTNRPYSDTKGNDFVDGPSYMNGAVWAKIKHA